MTPDEERAEYRSVSKLLNHVAQMVNDLGLGRIKTVLDMLAEHDRRITDLEDKSK